ncbi:MAG: class I SAM-dependent methyltransferase, partial [Flavobacterium sp.]
FNNKERFSFIDRMEALHLDGCLALAVIHHITLSGNVPFELSAKFFSKMAPNLLIEFPTRTDSWVQFLLECKREFKGHFDFYNEENFQKAYSVYFEIEKKEKIIHSERILYCLKRREIAE